jgi:hypothetical protein
LQVFAGAKRLLDKILGILVEGLIDTFLSLFHEYKTKDLRSLDANGFCQLMLEVKYSCSTFLTGEVLNHTADVSEISYCCNHTLRLITVTSGLFEKTILPNSSQFFFSFFS